MIEEGKYQLDERGGMVLAVKGGQKTGIMGQVPATMKKHRKNFFYEKG